MTDLASKSLQLALIFGVGLAGALVAHAVGLPIPFLLGSLAVTAPVALTFAARTGKSLFFFNLLRETFIAVAGQRLVSPSRPTSC